MAANDLGYHSTPFRAVAARCAGNTGHVRVGPLSTDFPATIDYDHDRSAYPLVVAHIYPSYLWNYSKSQRSKRRDKSTGRFV